MARATYNGKERFFKVGESGWPDIIGATKEGKFFGIEVKTRTGVLSESQAAIGKRILSTGGLWFVARSLDDVIAKGF